MVSLLGVVGMRFALLCGKLTHDGVGTNKRSRSKHMGEWGRVEKGCLYELY
jgi:hypothetical protein